MADINKYFPKVMAFEGGYVNNPLDAGGPTNRGVTLAVFQKYGYDKNGDGKIDAEDVKLISEDDAKRIMKKLYWDYMLADSIKTQPIAEIIVDWGWGSGPVTAAIFVQRLLNQNFNTGLVVDGHPGEKWLAAINGMNQDALYSRLREARRQHFISIVQANPSQEIFLKGWLRRAESWLPNLSDYKKKDL